MELDSHVLRVRGVGHVEVTPDRCRMQLAVVERAETSSAALRQVVDHANRAIAVLHDARLDDDAIRTRNVTLHEERLPPAMEVSGHVASYHLNVTVADLERAGEVLSSLVGAVGNALRVNSLELTVGDAEGVERVARRAAVADAQAKAVELADAAGVSLGEILAIDDDVEVRSGIPVDRRKLARPAPVPPVPMEPGPFSAVSSVAVVYSIA